jgi:hypothetical protein
MYYIVHFLQIFIFMTVKAKSLFFKTLCFVLLAFLAQAQNTIITNPQYEQRYENIKINKIEHTNKYTILYMTWKAKKTNYSYDHGSASLKRATVLRDYDNGTEYKLLDVENIASSAHSFSSETDFFDFTLFFARVPDEIEKVRLVECDESTCTKIPNIVVHAREGSENKVIDGSKTTTKATPVENPIYNFSMSFNTFMKRGADDRLWAAPTPTTVTFNFKEDGNVVYNWGEGKQYYKVEGGEEVKIKNPKNSKEVVQYYALKEDNDSRWLLIIYGKFQEIRLIAIESGAQYNFTNK